jgi:hypothetical protein
VYEFEFDEKKSKINKEKHGIDFTEVQKLFDKNISVYPAKNISSEKRYIISNCFEGKCFSAVFTLRNGKIRIISVRRCRTNEEKRLKNDNC